MGSIYEATGPDGRPRGRQAAARRAPRRALRDRGPPAQPAPPPARGRGARHGRRPQRPLPDHGVGRGRGPRARPAPRGQPGAAGGPTSSRYALEAAEALRYVHEQQTIHRDVKPQNLMLSPDRGVVLVDFGIARDLAAESATEGIGTPGYMAPEAFMGGPLSPRTDVYGLAMTAWTLLDERARALRERAAAGRHQRRRCSRRSTRRWRSTRERRLPSMQAFADGLGGRLPTERGRDIGVSAAVGEATARVLVRGRQDRGRRVRRRRHLDRAAAHRRRAGLPGRLGRRRRRGRRHAHAPGPGHRRPRARHRRRRGHPGLPQRPRLRGRDRAPDRLRALHDDRRAAGPGRRRGGRADRPRQARRHVLRRRRPGEGGDVR